MADSSAILADLRGRFGANRAVLMADEVAEAIGTPGGFAALRRSRGFPLKPVRIAGEACVSIYELADWIASGFAPKPEKTSGRLAPPARPRKDIARSIRALQTQSQFVLDLSIALEKKALAGLGEQDKEQGFSGL